MCVFCEIAKGNIPSTKIYEDDNVLAILDLSQVTRGHTLVMPKKHVDNFLEADEETVSQCIKVANQLAKKIVKNLNASGCNILNNNNEVAGQTVMHLHFHIIPRYSENDSFVVDFKEADKQDLTAVQKDILG
ncbi:MAG: HIT family protein [Erysipelotrichaceae bacterium]|nr:HIT family protein [Erysipelotrichaceae bacterium]